MIIEQGHIAINVSERERAVAFYRDVLGFEITYERPRPERNDILMFMKGNGITLEIFVDAGCPARPTYPEALGLRHLCFTVAEIENEWERITALGYEPEPIRVTGSGQKMFFVKDPDGLPIEFHE